MKIKLCLLLGLNSWPSRNVIAIFIEIVDDEVKQVYCEEHDWLGTSRGLIPPKLLKSVSYAPSTVHQLEQDSY